MPRKNSYKVSISDREAFIFMVFVLFAFCVYLFIRHMEMAIYISVGAFVADTIWLGVLRAQHKLTKRRMVISNVALILLFISLSIAWLTGKQVIFGILVGSIVAIVIVWKVLKRKKRKAITSDIDKQLRRALDTMDSTAKWYNNEEEANRELVTCLKAQGISDVIYQYRLGNGRTADTKVGDILIEGKLSPSTEEVDRLIGQLSDYIQYANKLNIVIYGQLDKKARRRIENEIQSRYLNRVFLTCLDKPRRQRAQVLL